MYLFYTTCFLQYFAIFYQSHRVKTRKFQKVHTEIKMLTCGDQFWWYSYLDLKNYMHKSVKSPRKYENLTRIAFFCSYSRKMFGALIRNFKTNFPIAIFSPLIPIAIFSPLLPISHQANRCIENCFSSRSFCLLTMSYKFVLVFDIVWCHIFFYYK